MADTVIADALDFVAEHESSDEHLYAGAQVLASCHIIRLLAKLIENSTPKHVETDHAVPTTYMDSVGGFCIHCHHPEFMHGDNGACDIEVSYNPAD